MSVLQQVFFFLSIMVLHWATPLLMAFVTTFLPVYESDEEGDAVVSWSINVSLLKRVSLFTTSFAYIGLIATLFAHFTLACVIGTLGGMYNLWSQRFVEKNFE